LARIEAGTHAAVRAERLDLHLGRVDQVFDEDDFVGRGFGHPVVSDHQQVGAIPQAALFQTGQQSSDARVGGAHGGAGLGGQRSVRVAGVIDELEIKRGKARALRRGEIEPREQAVDALFHRQLLVEFAEVTRTPALQLGFGAGPKKARGAHALFLGGDPDRFPAGPPMRFPLCHGEPAAGGGIIETVGNDAVRFGPQARDQRVVVRESLRRKRRLHSRHARAFAREFLQRRSTVDLEIVPAEAVDPDKDRDLVRRSDAPGREVARREK
jgi:hypothetical protein